MINKNYLQFFFALSIFTLSFTSSIHSADKKICRHCNNEITKSFIKVNGYLFHPSHFICYRCNATIEGSAYFFEDDYFYDDSCYKVIHRIVCDYCKKNSMGDTLFMKIKTSIKNVTKLCLLSPVPTVIRI